MNDYIQPVQQNAQLIAQMDCLCSFAQQAKIEQYSKPEIEEGFELQIEEGRHPVIEKQLPIGESYVTNSVFLDREEQQVIMITGPNMSGKSAILRQTALIVLMAQMGSFVPAKSANIGLVDKIFTRVGASDNISMGVNLIAPIAMDEGLRFAIREGGKTVGAGVVTAITE